jgi:hypothetical protein
MKIEPSLTSVRSLALAAATSSAQLFRLLDQIWNDQISPQGATDMIASILSPLQIEAEKPASEYRYFKMNDTIWKMNDTIWKMPASGTGFFRTIINPSWKPSKCSLSDMEPLSWPYPSGDFTEITELEGEP